MQATQEPPPMAKKPKAGYCVYTSTRIDDDILPLARAAAALSGDITTQEFISDAVNEVASRILNRPPIKRKPPAPHGKQPKSP